MDIWGELLGYIAGICATIVFLPQSIQTVKIINVQRLAFSSYVIYN